ncbi:MAG: hypothetical protein A3G95_02365 [Flavobacteria bacterium RIFCSPLOWO2_12_FULL_31_7]|jgi:hypothetical protein|nr:MAG: hypothetical protein A3G95_02365 [Flavobacteria bacterium RIFCSPLOWO2_12_FULL_31_7]
MCCNFTKVKETKNGSLIYMNNCKKFQLSFNNLHFSLDQIELDTFKDFLRKVDIGYWEKEYENSIYNKKIPIPTLQKNFIILIDRYELFELLSLLDFDTKNKGFLTYKDFENKIHFN